MIKQHFTRVRSKNFSCDDLRTSNKGIGPFPIRSLVRLGSTTMTEIIFPKSFKKYPIVEINSVESIQNSRSKLKMKECFLKENIPQSNWFVNHGSKEYVTGLHDNMTIWAFKKLSYPLVAKRVFGFKGHGMVLINNQEELEKFLKSKSKTELEGYYFEEFKNFSREYRLHCTQSECFMTWRKLRKSDSKERWFFNSTNCNWVGENHPLFDKPNNWNKIVEDCCKAIKAVGLDIGCVDLRIQSAKTSDGNTRKNPEYIVIETNSSPALGDRGIELYRQKITELINNKIKEL